MLSAVVSTLVATVLRQNVVRICLAVDGETSSKSTLHAPIVNFALKKSKVLGSTFIAKRRGVLETSLLSIQLSLLRS